MLYLRNSCFIKITNIENILESAQIHIHIIFELLKQKYAELYFAEISPIYFDCVVCTFISHVHTVTYNKLLSQSIILCVYTNGKYVIYFFAQKYETRDSYNT